MGVVLVPPEQLDLWTVDETASYKIWKGSISTKNSMEDYRLLMIKINENYNMDEIYDGIEAGLSALERLSDLSKCVLDFNVNDNLETTYGKEEEKIEKDFVKFGLKFVENYLAKTRAMNVEYIDTKDNEKCITVEAKAKPDVVDKEAQEDVQHNLSQGIGSDDVSNPVKEEDMAEDIGSQLQARKRKKKKKRSIGRLLKFHEKLCNQSGLPPSRLMEQQTPVCSSGGKKRRNLFDEIQGQEQQLKTKPKIPEPGIPAVGIGSSPFTAQEGAVQGEGQWQDGTRMSSGNVNFSTLSSGLPPAGLSPGWSDARP